MKTWHDEKAVVLARVSTVPQAQQGTSLDDQEVGCTGLAKREGWGIHATYREDGVSGGLYTSRSVLQAALADIEEGRASIFITHAVDRSGRDVRVLSDIRGRVLEAGGRFFLSSGQEFPDTPDGNFMFTMFAGQAQFEKDSIRRRTVGGRIRRASEEGKQPSRTWSPYGYRVVTKADVLLGLYPADLLGTYQVLRDKVQWVTGAYARFAAGASLRDIIRWFRENGVMTPEGLPEWSLSSVRRLLSHPVYKGKPAFGRTRRKINERRVGNIGGNGQLLKRPDYSIPRPEEEWITLAAEPLVSEEVWDECQRRLQENKGKRGGNPKRKYMLGGMVVCPACGKVTGGSTSNNKARSRYYKCPWGCKWAVTAILAETYTAHVAITLAERPELVGAALRAYNAKHAPAVDRKEETHLKDEIARLKKKHDAALEAELEARMDDPGPVRDARINDFRQKQGEIAARSAELGGRLIAAKEIGKQHQEMLTDAEKIAVAVASVREALESEHLTPVEKNEILSHVVAAIKPNQDRTHIVLVLRPFFYRTNAETVPQILMRVIVASRMCLLTTG